MKKFVLIFIIIFLFVITLYCSIYSIKLRKQLQNTDVQDKNIHNSKVYLIDKKLEKCISENFITSGMNICTYKGIQAWNKEILKYSKQIEQCLDKEEIPLFIKSQKAWNDYYKKEQDFLNNTIAQKDGDIHTTVAISNLYEISKQRALFLKSYLKQLED